MMYKISGLLISAIAILASCTSSSNKALPQDSSKSATTPEAPKAETEVPQTLTDSQITGFARFISGMNYPVKYKMNASAAWQNYATGNTKNWDVLDNRIGKKIRNWVSTSKLEISGEPKTLFYPFAGGDFYYPDLFFPNQDTTIMIGLEPCGSIFNPDKEEADTVAKYFKILQHSMFFPHQLGFFRTKSMKDDFNNHLLNGTIHTVLFYMSKAGYDLHYLKFFNLDANGNKIDETDAQPGDTKRYKGYRIGYSKNGKGLVQELVYFSQDASDGGLKSQPGVMAFMNKRGKVVTFYKAASYLMHYDRFSMVRNFATKNSVRLLQDDSGIPYKFLLSNDFDVTLYGKFNNTLNMFKAEFQPDLKEAYATSKADSLPFLIGYTAPRGECNLQLAKKRTK